MKTLAIAGVIALAVFGFVCSSYNGVVAADQSVKKQVGDLDAAYQRRADLIPNLVQVVEASGKFEKSTLTEVTEMRSKIGQLHITAGDLGDKAKVAAFQKAQAELSSSMGRLMAVAESYPQLKTTDAFRDLMTQVEGSENRIQTERRKMNDSISDYNRTVLSFPGSMVASHYGFGARESFQADAGAAKAPQIKFEALK